MLASITPLGERGRNNRYVTTATWFAVGATAGGALAGSVAGALGAAVSVAVDLPELVVGLTVAALAVVAAAMDARWFGARLPTTKRQVDERWMDTYRGWVYGGGWGFQLGLAFSTVVNSATVYVAFACALLSQSVLAGAAVGTAFGAVRGVSIFLSSSIRTPADLRTFHERFDRRQPATTTIAVVAMLVVGAAALAAGVAA